MEKKERLVKLEYPYYMYHENWNQAIMVFRQLAEKNQTVALGDYRDQLGTSRKYAVMILEAFDKKKITQKKDDVRILLKKE